MRNARTYSIRCTEFKRVRGKGERGIRKLNVPFNDSPLTITLFPLADLRFTIYPE